MRLNRAVLAIGMASITLLANGCTKKVGGQVVAVVNGQEVTQGELNAELNGQTIPANADRKAVMAQLLQGVVNRKLLIGRAKEQGLDKSPTYLVQVQRAQDAALINLMATNAAKTIAVPDATAADTFMKQNPSLFAGRKRYQLDQLVFQAAPDAALAAKLKAANSMGDVEAALNSSHIAFKHSTGQLDTATIPPQAAAQIAALPAGMPFIVPKGAQVVVSVVKSAEALPVPDAQARPAAMELLRRQSVEQAMRHQLDKARSAAKITYAPGFAPPPAPKAPPPMPGGASNPS